MKNPKNYVLNKAQEAGAQTTADLGVFLIGFATGGIADAVLNFAGFAEPLLCATLCGAGLLGLKKSFWDAPKESKLKKRSSSTTDDT